MRGFEVNDDILLKYVFSENLYCLTASLLFWLKDVYIYYYIWIAKKYGKKYLWW